MNRRSQTIESDSADEPRCLIGAESRWYRPGIGFTCRQIMLPLLAIALLSLALAGVLLTRTFGDQSAGFGAWLTATIPLIIFALTVQALLFVRQSLINPLNQIRDWVTRVRGGEFSARMAALPAGEFNQLAQDINRLADRVERLHGDLEDEVAAKTETLAHKTQALELLYEVVTLVNESNEAEDVLRHLMHRLVDVFGARAAVVRVVSDSRLVFLDSHGLNSGSPFMEHTVSLRQVAEQKYNGDWMVGVRSETINEILGESGRGRVPQQIISIPLHHRDSLLGSYQLFIDQNVSLGGEQREVLGSVGQHIGVMMEQSRLDSDTTRLLMIEERARLANELHDSLAQTLASLRFQTRVLDETLHQGDEQVTWEELEKLENQIEIANSELRSLMGQFRAPLQSREIVISIEKLVRRFRRDTGASVFFQNEWSEDSLSVEQRTHLIRIVQESLANINKHADANSVRVLIRNSDNGYRVVIEDDGKGYDESLLTNEDAGEHIGRQIMQERADSLGAERRLESEPGEGSSVCLEYQYRLDADSGTHTGMAASV